MFGPNCNCGHSRNAMGACSQVNCECFGYAIASMGLRRETARGAGAGCGVGQRAKNGMGTL